MFDRKNSILIIDNQNFMATLRTCVRTQRSDGLYKVFIRVTTIEIQGIEANVYMFNQYKKSEVLGKMIEKWQFS